MPSSQYNQNGASPLTSLLNFFVFSNIFIAICAVIMTWFTMAFLVLPVNYSFMAFVFFGTLCSYSFHWYLPGEQRPEHPRDKWNSTHKKLLLVLFILSFTCSVYFFILIRNYWWTVAPVLLMTFIYSAPKIPLKPFRPLNNIIFAKTLYVAAAWSLVTVGIPIVLNVRGLGSINFIYGNFFLSRFFFIFALSILFDMKDRISDRQHGIKSIVTLLEPAKVKIIFYTVLMMSLIFAVFLNSYFSLSDIFILIIPVVAAWLSYKPDIEKRSDLWFYLYLDGLTVFSALLLITKQVFYRLFL